MNDPNIPLLYKTKIWPASRDGMCSVAFLFKQIIQIYFEENIFRVFFLKAF